MLFLAAELEALDVVPFPYVTYSFDCAMLRRN